MYFTVFLKKDDDDDDSTTCQGRIQVQIFQGGGGEADTLGLQNRYCMFPKCWKPFP